MTKISSIVEYKFEIKNVPAGESNQLHMGIILNKIKQLITLFFGYDNYYFC